jgi:hypothetical protein
MYFFGNTVKQHETAADGFNAGGPRGREQCGRHQSPGAVDAIYLQLTDK